MVCVRPSFYHPSVLIPITVMAAAGLARSKGLLIIFTLLCLVCFSSSLIDKNQLEELRENVQKLQQEALRRKADHKLGRAYLPEIFDDVTSLMDPLAEIINTVMKDFTPLLDFIDDIKTFLEATKKYINKDIEMEDGEIKDYEEKLNGVMARIIHLEKHKDEL